MELANDWYQMERIQEIVVPNGKDIRNEWNVGS
jgi:hypothetical protein